MPRAARVPAPQPDSHPGAGLGLPAEGPGSIGGWGRRIVGLCIDWAVASVIAHAFVNATLGRELGPLAVFALMHVVLVGTTGFTIGHFLAGLVVRRADGGFVGPLRALLRTALLCLVIPAVVSDPDQRGLHDRAAGTVIVRR
ncbi:RDD family protein [Kineococcus xinjiangensis]|uniref:RDD family protein n=1 Tax=Kineococcus xinjiangensis TaxID=512762 RepID=A0A2S6IMA9_9ACTN|nr:RDD family protein [Kineococcus xinjiangensis]PPK95338.1 RDD family protein [Kineococcus xinjiangensis]